MMLIPELSDPGVRHSGQGAPGWRPPVSNQNRLPYNQHVQFPFRMLRKKLCGCGGPPQTIRSCRRKQQNQADRTGVRVECAIEPTGVCRGKCRERLLARWDGPRSPKQVDRTEQNDRRDHSENDEFLFHSRARQSPPAMRLAIC
jgi:hypothetical protein